MFEHPLDTADRFVKHRKRAPQVVAGAATNAREVLAAAATTDPAVQLSTIRGHISLLSDGTSRGRTYISPTVVTVTDTAAAAAATTVAEEPTTTARTTAVRPTTTTAPAARTTAARAATSSSSSAAPVANTPASSSAADTSGSSSAARTTGSSTSNAANGAASGSGKDDSSSGISGGAVAGIIIALLLVAALGAGFFFWRRKRNARLARGSGSGLIGGRSPDMAGAGAGAGAYKKQHETGDSELFANSSASPMWNASANGGEKPHDEYGATSASSWPPPPPQSQQGQRDSFVAPSFTSYPASSSAAGGQGWPNSTANLLGAAGVGTAAAAAAAAGGERSMSPFADPHHESIEQREMQQELENQRQAQAAAAAAAAAAVAAPAAAASPFGESEGQGEVRIVKGTFVPNLDDELIFQPGDRVQVLMKYDDGWALGVNLSAGTPSAKGVFPFDCLGDIVDAPSSSSAAPPAPLPAPVHPALQPGQLAKHVPSLQVATAAPVNPANVPLPPPTPTGLEPISELSASAPVVSASAPQLAPLSLDRNDSPLSASFPAHGTLAAPAQPQQSSTSLTAKGSKRASSLIASRDADLFVALGEVLDKKDRKDEDESLI
ncbi:hypothetical protein JCM8208_005136 [Rhodotorula glutinis]